MRVAISGTHFTGKSTLVAALAARLPDHTTVPEPYELLEERGYDFAHPPTLEDFVVQLKQSLATLRRRTPNLILDRCPLDFLAYIAASRDADRFDLELWRAPVATALATLDLLVSVHIDPAHDPVGLVEDAAYRADVDTHLRDILDGDTHDLCGDLAILPLTGPWDRRADTVLAHLAQSHPSRSSWNRV